MGVKQSKRSVDITEISTKGEIEGFGNEGKVEKIIDGVVDKVAVNGHVDGELQNGVEAHQNGLEPIQNGEAAAVATEKVTEKKEIDDSPVEGVVNGQVENGEVHAEGEKTDEAKKSEEKKDKRKEKKEKVVKKKFSFRNFSFSKKDKSKPPKEEKSPEKVDEAGIEETPTSPEKEEIASPSEGQLAEQTAQPEEPANPESDSTAPELTTTPAPEQLKQELQPPPELSPQQPPAPLDDLPPPLPASPPPCDSIQAQMVSDLKEIDSSESAFVDNSSGEMNDVASSISNFSPVRVTESASEGDADAEQIVFQAGKQIEEKATNLLRTVEERQEESLRMGGEAVTSVSSPKAAEGQDAVQSESLVEGADEGEDEADAKQEAMAVATADVGQSIQEPISTIPVDIANLGSLSPKGEAASDKMEEGAGESLADIPKDLREEVTAATIEASNADILEVTPTIPAPAVEAETGE